MLNVPGLLDFRAHYTIGDHLRSVGIEPPAGAVYALEVDRALGEASNPDISTRLTADIAAHVAVPDLVEHLTADLTRAAASQHVAGLRRDVQRQLDAIARQALYDDADRIFTELAPIFDEASAEYRETTELVGTEPNREIDRRPGLKAVWDRVVAAQNRLDAIRDVRTDMADLGVGPREEGPSWYVTNANDLEAAPATLKRILAETDIVVRLNTPEQIDAILAGVAAIEEERSAAAAQKLRTPHQVRAEREWAQAVATIRSGGGGEAA